MKVIIAGTRTVIEYDIIDTAVKKSNFQIDEVVSGWCRGVDTLGEQWGKNNKVPIKTFKAKWLLYGSGAGPKRNLEMAQYVGENGGLIAIWDGKSKGTKNMIETAQKIGIKNIFIFRI